MAKRILSIILALSLVFSMTGLTAFAEGTSLPIGESGETIIGVSDSGSHANTDVITITAFDSLPEAAMYQSVPAGTPLSALNLPITLVATGYTTDSTTPAAITIENITWQPDNAYDDTAETGAYIFTAVLPVGYALAEDVSLPEIYVMTGATVSPFASNPSTNTFDISEGAIIIANGTNANTVKVTYGASAVKDNIPKAQTITLTGTNTNISYRVRVECTGTVNITLDNLNINVFTPFGIYNSATVNLTLVGINRLESYTQGTGLYVPQGSAVVIDGSGSLFAKGRYGGSGIGGGCGVLYSPDGNPNAGSITVNGGTVTAEAFCGAAAIGAGFFFNGTMMTPGTAGSVTVNGGTVLAYSTGDRSNRFNDGIYAAIAGAAIGGCHFGNGGTVTINGGTVTANAAVDFGAAGIGSGSTTHSTSGLTCGTININGGTINARGGGLGAPAIGNGVHTNTMPNPSGSVTVTGNPTFNLTNGGFDPLPTGNNVTPVSMNLKIYDGRITTGNHTYTVQIGSVTLPDISYNSYEAYTAQLQISTYLIISGTQTVTVTNESGFSWMTTVDISSSEVSFGSPLRPVTLWFYDYGITQDITGVTVTASQNSIPLNASNTSKIINFIPKSTITKVATGGIGKMDIFLPENSGETDISVTTASLNDGNVMTKTGQTVYSSGTNITIYVSDADEFEEVLDLSYGNIIFTDDGSGKLKITYTDEGGSTHSVPNLSYDTNYRIIQSNPETATANSITVKDTGGKTVLLTLAGVNIFMDSIERQCIAITNAKTELWLDGENNLKTNFGNSSNASSCIFVKSDSECTFKGDGILNATILNSNSYSAVIGGNSSSGNGSITINSGTVNATSNGFGAAIGGGTGNKGLGAITITGGIVNATTNHYGAAIGSGYYGSNSADITVSGGTVRAISTQTGYFTGAAIGKGYFYSGGTGGIAKIAGGSVFISNASSHVDKATLTGDGTNPVYKTTVDLSSLFGNNAAVTPATLTGYGFNDVKTDSTGKIYIYLPGSDSGTATTAQLGGKTFMGNIFNNDDNILSQQIVLTARAAQNITATGATIPVTSDETSQVYYASLSSAPANAAALVTAAGSNFIDVTANTDGYVTLTGLTPSANHTYYLVAKKGEIYSEVQSVTFTTPAIPTYATGFSTSNVAQNGVTATGVVSPTGNQQEGTPITATVTLTGAATAVGTHTIGLTSVILGSGITPPTTITKSVAAGESMTAGDTFAFIFDMPDSAVTDLVVTHSFTAATVTGIVVKTQPTKLTYTEGKTLDLSALVATLTYSNSTTKDVAYADFAANGITVAYTGGGTAVSGDSLTNETHGGKTLTVTANSHTAVTNAITVNVPPAVTTISLPAGGIGIPYNQTLAATGTGTMTWSIDSGTLPNGLSLTGNTISGTPTTAETANFTVKAANGTLPDATKALSIVIASKQNGDSQITAFPAIIVNFGGTITPAPTTSMTGGSWTYEYEGSGSTTYTKSTNKPTSVGTYTMTATYENATHIGVRTATLTINPVAPAVPTGLPFTNYVASWLASANAASYSVQLYKNGTAQGAAQTTTATTYDFTSIIQAAGAGSYTFKVTATGTGNYGGTSTQSAASGAFVYTVYTVTFNANGGTGSMSQQSFSVGLAQNLTTNTFTRAGYTFSGWNTAANGGGTSYTDAQNVTPTSSMTLYAKWTPEALTGTVTVAGTAKFKQTLTATVTSTNNTGTLHYQWKSGGVNVTGANAATYILTTSDIGKTITCVVTSSAQTSGIESTATATVAKADALTIPAQIREFKRVVTHSGSVDIAALLPSDRGTTNYGIPSSAGTYTENLSTSTGVLNFRTKTATAPASEDITVVVTMENYESTTVTVQVKLVDQIVPTGTPTISGTLTYGQPLSTLRLSVTMMNGGTPVSGTITWDNPTSKPAVGAGAQDWIFTPSDTVTYAAVQDAIAITVQKATPSGTPSITSITATGKTLADAALTGSFTNPHDNSAVLGALEWDLGDTTAVTAGTSYAWTFTPTDISNYATRTGSFIPYANATYTVTFNANAGSVTPSTMQTGTDGKLTSLPTPSRGGHSFNGWFTAASGGTSVTTSTVFIANTTIFAQWTQNSGGTTPGGNDDSGSNSSGSSSGVGSTTSTTTITTETLPNMPTTVTASVAGTVKDGVLSATITEKMAKDAIAAVGTNANGIGVQFNLTASGSYHSFSVTIDRAALEALQAAGVKYIKIGSVVLDLNIDAKTIAGILTQTIGNVTVSATKQTKISDSAKAYIGNRPVLDITIMDSKGKSVSDLKDGTATIGIAYKPTSAEKSGNLYGVYVDKNGKPQLLTNSSYENGKVIFGRNSLSVYGVGYKTPVPAFTDTTKHWAKDNIDFVASRGLIAGTTTTAFSPDVSVTRATFLIALGNLSGADVNSYKTSSFADVRNTDPATPYIEWAVKNSIVQGIGNNQFGPDLNITREQMAVMMVNYAKVTSYKLPVSYNAVTFEDNAKISSWSADAVKAIQQTGVISGKPNNLFDPQGNATRAEAATILRRFVELVIEEGAVRGWVKNDAGQWQYIGTNGKAVIGWQIIEGNKYYFDSNGKMQTGKVPIGDKTYYFEDHGVLAVKKEDGEIKTNDDGMIIQ